MSQIPKHIIDMHTHMFNARYLPLKGITRHYLGETLAGAFATIMNSITKSSFREAPEDWAALEYVRTKAVEGVPADYAEALWMLIEGQIKKRARRQLSLFKSLKHVKAEREAAGEFERDALMQALESLAAAATQKTTDRAVAVDKGQLIGQILHDVPVTLLLAGMKKTCLHMLRQIADTLQQAHVFGDAAHDYLEFFFTMTRDETSMLEKIRLEYRNDQPIRFFVHYMMDMKYGCGIPDDPYYAFFPQQCEYMVQLTANSGGRLLGFSAFDPRRDNWREIAEKSLRMGFIGFKFYPSMGFLPIGNSDAVVEERVEEFLLYCIKRNVPVVAHCTPGGFQAVRGSGINADPRHWKKRLSKNGFEKLRLNLCHAGGGEQRNGDFASKGWYAANDAEWQADANYARTVVELCTAYDNVYCDVSYLLELYEQGHAADTARAHFERNLLREMGKETFAKKIIFGSDWNMPQIIDETDDYLDYYLKLFSKPEFSAFREDFFWKNALAFLNLPGYLDRLDGTAEKTEVAAYARAVRSKYELLGSS